MDSASGLNDGIKVPIPLDERFWRNLQGASIPRAYHSHLPIAMSLKYVEKDVNTKPLSHPLSEDIISPVTNGTHLQACLLDVCSIKTKTDTHRQFCITETFDPVSPHYHFLIKYESFLIPSCKLPVFIKTA